MGSFPGHHCKANIAVEQVTDILLFPSGSKSYVYICTSTAEGPGATPGRGTKIPQAL